MGPFELFQTADTGLVGGEVLAEDDQAVGAQQHRRGSQRRRDEFQVAQRHPANLGLGKSLKCFRDGRRGRAVLAWSASADAQLITALMQTERPGLVVETGITTSRRCVGESGRERVEHVIGELVEFFVGPQAHQRQGAAGDITGPVRRPPKPAGDVRDPGDIVAVALPPLDVEIPGCLSQQQIQIRNENIFQETPGDERPGTRASQIGETCPG